MFTSSQDRACAEISVDSVSLEGFSAGFFEGFGPVDTGFGAGAG